MIARTIQIALVVFLSFATAQFSFARTDVHSSNEVVVTVRVNKIVHYENGMTIVLERPVLGGESCFHVENAASFSEANLEKIQDASLKKRDLKLKVQSGNVVAVL